MRKINTKRSILVLAIATVAFILYYNYNYSQTAEPAGPVIKKIENDGKYCWRLPQVKAVPEATARRRSKTPRGEAAKERSHLTITTNTPMKETVIPRTLSRDSRSPRK